MATFMEYSSDNEEDMDIVKDANKAMYNLKQWQKLEDKRSQFNTSIERAIKLKFPRITNVYITQDSIEVSTELHSNRISRWSDSTQTNIPKFKCDIQAKDLPDTAEEFMVMKNNIKADKQEIMTAMNYIRFRYNIERT